MSEPIEIPCLNPEMGVTPIGLMRNGKPVICLDARNGGANKPYEFEPVKAIQLAQAILRAAEEIE